MRYPCRMEKFAVHHLLWVGAGGFVGSVLRYAVSLATQRTSIVWGFPIGTLAVNLIGCFAVGAFGAWAVGKTSTTTPWVLFLLVGLLGGFTTFSAFGNETAAMLRDGHSARAGINVLLQVIVGVGAVFAGIAVVRSV